MHSQHFSIAELPVTPWKNGGGSTRELASWPPGAGLEAFDWRVSIATIAASGPFSVFAGVDRTIMLLQGDGVRLRARDGSFDHRLDQPFEPFAFSGDLALDCTLPGAASGDFNLMSRRTRCRAALRVIDQARVLDPTPHGVLLSLRGTWRLRGAALTSETMEGSVDVLDEGHGLWWADAPGSPRLVPMSDGARLAWVSVDTAAAATP